MPKEIKPNLVGGDWIATNTAIENRNPSDLDQVIGLYSEATLEQIEHAVDAARRALPGWTATSPQVRADILFKAAAELDTRRNELGRLLSAEEGKIVADGIGEVTRAAQILRYYAGEAVRMGGTVIDSVRPGVTVEVRRRPVGVVVLITPWNFPIGVPAWKIAPALAYGNTVIFKPSPFTPALAWVLTDILVRAGIPKGVLSLLVGQGDTGAALVAQPGVDAVSFTGSSTVGREVATTAAARGAAVQTELGGKNPLVVLADADLENAVDCALNGAYFQTGQRCTASSRIIVENTIYDEFVDRLTTRIKGLKVGHALEEATQMGPVINQHQLDKDLTYIRVGQDEGAELIFGGEVLNRPTPGHYLSPALFVNTTNHMRINQEEIFGPVAAIIKVTDYDEALAVANDTDFGLSSAICTRSMKHAEHFKAHSAAGMSMVNLPTAGVDYHVPFGGEKGSGYGPKEQGQAALEFFTRTTTHYSQPL